MLQLQTIFFIIIVISLFSRFRIGLALYIAYYILIPFKQIEIGGITISAIVVNSILITSFFFDLYRYKVRFSFAEVKIFKPLVILYFIYLAEILFQTKISNSIALVNWGYDMMSIFVLPFIICFVSTYDNLVVRYCTISVIISFIITWIYGIYLLTIPGLNPYVFMMAELHGQEIRMGQFTGAIDRTDITTRVSAVFPHPFYYSLYIGLMSASFFSLYDRKRKIYLLMFAMAIIGVFTCGVRTAILALCICVVIYLLHMRNFKTICYSVLLFLFAYFILIQFPQTYNMVQSIIYESKSMDQGSNIYMRFDQFWGCIEEIKDNMFWGNGYKWTAEYLKVNEIHPKCYTFESVVFVQLCNWGIVGLMSYFILLFIFYKNLLKLQFDRSKLYALSSILFYYFVYSFITGDYGYLQYCLLFFSIVLVNLKERNKLICEKVEL